MGLWTVTSYKACLIAIDFPRTYGFDYLKISPGA